MIPYGRQDITEQDVDEVVKVLRSDFLTQGPVVPNFESAVAAYCNVNHAIAVNSATSALHLACLALGVSSGDWVWTSPISFVASANCALYCGANIDFVDIDQCTYNISLEALTEKLEKAKQLNKLPKALVVVHLAGMSADMVSISALSEQYGFKIIEDASHAIGAKYNSEPVGNCKYSDIAVFSFHPVKIITTGEGGMAVTNNADLARKIQLLRSHGVTREESEMTQASHGGWYYQQIALGYNYRMTDIQAAIGLSQLDRLDDYIIKRHEIANYYNSAFGELPIKIPFQAENTYSSFHLYIIRVAEHDLTFSRAEFFAKLRQTGVGVNVHYIPIYLQPYYQQFSFKPEDFPHAQQYYAEALSLPIYPLLSNDAQEKVVNTINDLLSK